MKLKAYITITFTRPVDRSELDIGAFTLTHRSSGRGYTLDVDGSWLGDPENLLGLRATEARDIFPEEEYRYDLTVEDIKSGELDAMLFLAFEDTYDAIESITYELMDDDENILAEGLPAHADL